MLKCCQGGTDKLTTTNPFGFCQLPGCHEELETLQHILLECPCLTNVKYISHWTAFLVSRQWLFPKVVENTLGEPKLNFQFLLDPSVLPSVISASKANPEILRDCFYSARTFYYKITKFVHRCVILRYISGISQSKSRP